MFRTKFNQRHLWILRPFQPERGPNADGFAGVWNENFNAFDIYIYFCIFFFYRKKTERDLFTVTGMSHYFFNSPYSARASVCTEQRVRTVNPVGTAASPARQNASRTDFQKRGTRGRIILLLCSLYYNDITTRLNNARRSAINSTADEYR